MIVVYYKTQKTEGWIYRFSRVPYGWLKFTLDINKSKKFKDKEDFIAQFKAQYPRSRINKYFHYFEINEAFEKYKELINERNGNE
jgi:hypothetical protein